MAKFEEKGTGMIMSISFQFITAEQERNLKFISAIAQGTDLFIQILIDY